MSRKKTKKRKPGPVPGSKRTKRNEQLRDRLIDGTVAGLRAKAGSQELYEYLAALAGVQNTNSPEHLSGDHPQNQKP